MVVMDIAKAWLIPNVKQQSINQPSSIEIDTNVVLKKTNHQFIKKLILICIQQQLK